MTDIPAPTAPAMADDECRHPEEQRRTQIIDEPTIYEVCSACEHVMAIRTGEARATPTEALDVERLAQAMDRTWIQTVHRDPMGRLSDLRILAGDTIAQLRLLSGEGQASEPPPRSHEC